MFCQTNSKDILKNDQKTAKAEKSKGFDFKKIAPKTSFLAANVKCFDKFIRETD